MTSCFMSIETSVISGALLYSKGISYLFPIGKRRVLFAKRSYDIDRYGFEPVHRQQNRRPTEVDRLNNLWVGRQGFSLLRTRTLRRFRALRAALANAHAFTQLRAPTGSNP